MRSRQWFDEIRRHVHSGALRVVVYGGQTQPGASGHVSGAAAASLCAGGSAASGSVLLGGGGRRRGGGGSQRGKGADYGEEEPGDIASAQVRVLRAAACALARPAVPRTSPWRGPRRALRLGPAVSRLPQAGALRNEARAPASGAVPGSDARTTLS
jgi:hypothetical protein